MPQLGKANKKTPPQFELEYMTYPLELLHPAGAGPEASASEFVYPVPLPLLPESLRTPGLEKSKYAPYQMRDLTIPSWIRLGQRIADEKRRKLRKRFRKYMFLGGDEE